MSPNEVFAQSEQNSQDRPESAEPENSGARHSFLRELTNSAAYAAVEQPALGIAQFISNDAMRSVKNRFSEWGVEAPQTERFNSSGWYAQTFGSAVGMMVPFALTKFGLGKMGAFGEAAAVESSLLSRKAAIGLSLRESAITGFTYGTLFTPSDQSARNAGMLSFLADRAVSGVGSGITFTTLTAGSLGVGALAETGAATRFGLKSTLKNKIFSGVVGGLPGGFVGAEYDALARHRRGATAEELAESMLSMAVVGGTFGGASYAKNFGRAWFDTRSRGNEPGGQLGAHDQSARESATDNNVVALNVVPSEQGRKAEAVPRELVAPTSINPNEFRLHPNADQNIRLALTPGEQELWRTTQNAKSFEEFRAAAEQIDELPADKRAWFSETLDRQGKNLTDAELSSLWPRLLQKDAHQGYRVAKQIGPERATKIWQQQLEAVQQFGNDVLADQLAKTMVFIEPSQQLKGLEALLNLKNPPSYLDMTSVTLAKENQFAAAKMLEGRGILPQIETGGLPASVWADWALELAPGRIRNGVLEQLGKKVGGSQKNAAEELNAVYKIAQTKAAPNEYELFNSMLTRITPKYFGPEGVELKAAALKDIDPKFIGRMTFYEKDWARSDRLAEQNPDLVRALAVNSRFSPSLERSAFLSELMTRKPPSSAEQLTDTLLQKNRQAQEQKQYVLLSPGDIKALVEHGVKVSPNEVPALLRTLNAEVMHSFDLAGDKQIHMGRLLSTLTLANEVGKNNPDAFYSEFRQPIEAALTSNDFRYDRRLEASKALGEMQRAGFDAAKAIQMPELRLGKIVDLPPEQAAQMRGSIENAFKSKEALRRLLGDGPLGRLMPSIFGHASEGGIVGRKQHQTHSYSLENHLLEVVDKVGKDPEFQKLLPYDQTNLFWASFLHDVGKAENMVDHDHNRTSVSTAWGVLRSLGYSDTRIQRITDIMSKDAELSFNPDKRNSKTLDEDRKALDNVVNNYRHADALAMVAILNRSDIKSVKAGEEWYTTPVIKELRDIHEVTDPRVDVLNRHLLPLMPSKLPQGFGGHVMTDYTAFGHSTYDLTGQFLKQRSTIESPEYSTSFSVFTPENHRVYNEGAQIIALVTGPFEHIAQANRANLSTGTSVGWNGHVELVDRWSQDHRAKALAEEAEAKLAELGIPAARDVPAENFPRLNHLRRVAGQFDYLDDLASAAGKTDPYVMAVEAVNRMMTIEKDGSPLKTNNEGKLNNAILSGVGLLRKGNQPVYFEGLSQPELQQLFNGNVPDFVSAGPIYEAPANSLHVNRQLITALKEHNLPIVILNDKTVTRNH